MFISNLVLVKIGLSVSRKLLVFELCLDCIISVSGVLVLGVRLLWPYVEMCSIVLGL